MKFIALLLTLVSGVVFSQSADITKYGVDSSFHVPIGLNIGDIAPTFETHDIDGNKLSLEELTTKGPVVILFYRGQWCPVCSRYLSNLNDSVQLLVDQGATIIAFGPETRENALKMKNSIGSKFSFVADTSLIVHRAYDVLFYVTKKYQNKIKYGLGKDIAKNNAMKDAMLPVPATYVINVEGKIIYKQFDYNYKNRASVKSILDHLKS